MTGSDQDEYPNLYRPGIQTAELVIATAMPFCIKWKDDADADGKRIGER